MTPEELLVCAADAFLERYKAIGHVEPGSNGPHAQPETAVRNTCHWLVTLERVHRISGDEAYVTIGAELARYLGGTTARPYGKAFHQFDTGVDRCNGLIGPAWAFEGLSAASRLTGDRMWSDIGEALFLEHLFDRRFAVWHSYEVDGTHLNVDNVFNHQLWFAAAAAGLQGPEAGERQQRIRTFLDNVEGNMSLHEDGLIRHHIQRVMRSPRHRLQGFLKHLRNGSLRQRMRRTASAPPSPEEKDRRR